MWIVVYIASNRAQAELYKNLLCNEGLFADIRAAGVVSALGDGLHEVLVLESEIDEAHTILCQHVTR